LFSAIHSIAFDARTQGSASKLCFDSRPGRRVGCVAHEASTGRNDRIPAFQQRFRIVTVETRL